MKNELLCFILILISSSLIRAQTIIECKDLEHIVECEAMHHEKISGLRTNVLTENYDLRYHRLEWTIDPAVNFIEGRVTSYFVPSSDDFTQINFDFADNMTVIKVEYHGELLNGIGRTNDNLQIDLGRTIPRGQLDSISIEYSGAPNSNGFGSFELGTPQ